MAGNTATTMATYVIIFSNIIFLQARNYLSNFRLGGVSVNMEAPPLLSIFIGNLVSSRILSARTIFAF